MKKIAICGCGPAGMYLASKLLKISSRKMIKIQVDFFEKLPVPYGLLRYGVAPDHEHMKLPANQFDQIFAQNKANLSFFGNVDCQELYGQNFFARNQYSHLILAHGHSKPRRLGLADDLTYSAMDFVNFYNSKLDYEFCDKKFGKCMAIFGGGNVTLDLIRLFLKSRQNLENTDINDDFLQFKASKLKNLNEINIFIRGEIWPSKMTTVCLREIFELENVSFNFLNFSREIISNFSDERRFKRYYELIQKMISKKSNSSQNIKVNFIYNAKPIKISQTDSQKIQIDFKNSFDSPSKTALLCNISGETIIVDTVIESIGFESAPLDEKIPFDTTQNCYRNNDGFIDNPHENFANYCVGWCKNGSRGILAESMHDSFRVAEKIMEDNYEIPDSNKSTEEILKENGHKNFTTFDDWISLKKHEDLQGQKLSKTRSKFVTNEAIVEFLNQIKC